MHLAKVKSVKYFAAKVRCLQGEMADGSEGLRKLDRCGIIQEEYTINKGVFSYEEIRWKGYYAFLLFPILGNAYVHIHDTIQYLGIGQLQVDDRGKFWSYSKCHVGRYTINEYINLDDSRSDIFCVGCVIPQILCIQNNGAHFPQRIRHFDKTLHRNTTGKSAGCQYQQGCAFKDSRTVNSGDTNGRFITDRRMAARNIHRGSTKYKK